MAEAVKSCLVVGDSERRISIRMPVTLASLLSRVRKVYSVDRVDLWLDSGAQGHRPGQGRELIRNENDYKKIIDGDVIVFVTHNGMSLPVTPGLAEEFSTTYLTDYTAKEFMKPLTYDYNPKPLPEPYKPPYTTTYQCDFIEREAIPESVPHATLEKHQTAKFTGTTTYRNDYIYSGNTRIIPQNEPEPHFPKIPFSAHSTYSQHYRGLSYPEQKHRKPLTIPDSNPQRPRGYPLQPTEHQNAFKPHPMQSPLNATPQPPFMNAPNWPLPASTYKRDFQQHNISGSRMIHVEPKQHDF